MIPRWGREDVNLWRDRVEPSWCNVIGILDVTCFRNQGPNCIRMGHSILTVMS